MSASAENPHAGQGSVLLDIGGDVGALVVLMPPGLDGAEVEARRAAPSTAGTVHHPHVEVVHRPVGGGSQPSLVFPDLVEGDYGLGLKADDEVCLTARVRGGQVTTVHWPA